MRTSSHSTFLSRILAAFFVLITLLPVSLQSAPPSLVKDTNGSGNSNPSNFVEANGKLFFSTGAALMCSDGTEEGTTMVKNLEGITSLVSLDEGQVFFTKATMGSGLEIWKSDGTTEGTIKIQEFFSGGNPYVTTSGYYHGASLLCVGDKLYVAVVQETLSPPGPREMSPQFLNQTVYLYAYAEPLGMTLIRSFTFPVRVYSGDNLPEMVSYQQNGVYLSVVGGLWCVNDSSAELIHDSAYKLTKAQDTVYFNSSLELWKIDETSNQVSLIKTVATRDASCTLGDTLYFLNQEGGAVRIWESDGTEVGTVILKSIPGSTINLNFDRLVTVGDTIYFSTTSGLNQQLWKSDGTEGGTELVKSIASDEHNQSISNLTSFGGLVYFSANDGVNGSELWQSDGTEAGTVIVADITGDSNSSSPDQMFPLGSRLFFSATTPQFGRELYVYEPNPALVPDAFVLQAKDILSDQATLMGFVDFKGLQLQASVVFEWGLDGVAFPNSVAATLGSSNGVVFTPVSVVITGLASQTTYYYRLKTTYPGGELVSNVKSFQIVSPIVQSLSLSNLSNNSASLSSLVNSNGIQTNGVFEYRKVGDVAYTSTTTISAGAGTVLEARSKEIYGLQAHTEYEWRAVFTNSAGTTTVSGPNFTTSNRSPVATADGPAGVYTINVGDVVTLPVLSNDTDADGDSLQITAETSNRATIVNNGKELSFDGSGAAEGSTYEFTYTLSDGFGGSATVSVEVFFRGKPGFGSYTVDAGYNSVYLSLFILPNGFTSVDGYFEYRKVGESNFTSGDTLENVPQGIKYQTLYGLQGHTEYEWRAVFTNGAGTTTMNGPNFTTGNRTPVAVNDGPAGSYTFLNTAMPTLSVIGNDTDADEDTLTITSVTQGAHGVVGIASGGSAVSYDPEDSYVGADSFIYTISDGYGGTATGTVNVVMDSAHPVITNTPGDIMVSMDEGESFELPDLLPELEATDDVEVTSKTQSPVAGTELGLGVHTITFTVSDAVGHEVTATSTVTVIADYPVSSLDTASGGEVPGRSGMRYASFGAVGLDGEIPVFGSLVQTGAGPRRGAVTVSTPDGQETIAVLDAAPDLAGYVFSNFKDPVGNGGSAFVASVKPLLNPRSKVDDCGLWTNALNDAFGEWKLVARKGHASPVAGLNCKAIKDIALNDGGHLLWTAQLAGVSAASDTILCMQSSVASGAEVLLREGQTITDGLEQRRIKSFLALPAPARGAGDGRYNGGANTCVLVTFVGGARGIVMVGEDYPAEVVAATGSIGLTDVQAKWDALFLPAMAGDEAVVFRGKLKVGMAGVVQTTAEGIFTNLGGAGVITLVRAGEEVEEISGATFVSFEDPTSDAAGNVSFLAKIKTGSATSEALFNIPSGETHPELIVQSGQAIGDTGMKIKSFTSLAMSRGEDDHSGGIIFTAVLVPATGAATQTTGLCAVDSEGEVQVLAQTGDSVEVNGTDRTLQQISALSYVLSSPSAARSAGDVSHVVYRATFTDKTQAIIKVVVP